MMFLLFFVVCFIAVTWGCADTRVRPPRRPYEPPKSSHSRAAELHVASGLRDSLA